MTPSGPVGDYVVFGRCNKKVRVPPRSVAKCFDPVMFLLIGIEKN